MKNTNRHVGIVAANHTGYVSALFSCMEAGDVAVPLKSERDQYRVKVTHVKEIVTPKRGDAWMTPNFKTLNTDNTALITFTSGTTGNPKGVILSHNNLSNVVMRLNAVMRVDSDIREYIGVPVYHSFGLGRCRAVAAVGGQFFIPMMFRPAQIGEMLRKGRINAISAVPGLWRILLANKDLIGSHGKRVKWIEIGSQYMGPREKEELRMLFPNARIVLHYGLTEASRTTLLEIHQEDEDRLKSVGRALGEVKIKLTVDQNIAISGPHVAKGYIIDGKERPVSDKEGWLVTKDLGKIDDGYLYYQGRSDDVINYGGMKISPELLENKIYNTLQCKEGLAIGRGSGSMRGDCFLVAFTPEIRLKRRQLHEIAHKALIELGINAFNAITVVEVTQLPRTASGKVQRHRLSEYAK